MGSERETKAKRLPLAEEVYAVAARALRDNAVIECFIGSASKGHGITRLMKSLRHDAPGVEQTRSRFGAGTLAVGALADQLKHLVEIDFEVELLGIKGK